MIPTVKLSKSLLTYFLILFLSFISIISANVSAQNNCVDHNNISLNYDLILLKSLGGPYSRAYAVSNTGIIVGSSQPSTELGEQAVYWLQGEIYELGTLGGSSSIALGVNDNGYAVGVSFTENNAVLHATLWDGTSVLDLGADLIGKTSVAYDINNHGYIVGNSFVEGSLAEATAWHWEHEIDITRMQGGGTFSSVNAINDQGYFVGNGNSGEHVIRSAFVWPLGSTPIDIGSWSSDVTESFAKGINEHNVIAGTSYPLGEDYAIATVWYGQSMIFLSKLPDSITSVAYGINNNNDVVGVSYFANQERGATAWKEGHALNLNNCVPPNIKAQGWHLDVAQANNDLGWIVGAAINQLTGEIKAFLLVEN